MAIDFKTFNETAPLVLNSKYPVLLRGRHGVGKSQVVYQVAKNMRLPVVERRASQMTEGDLLGIPSPDGININGEQASKFRPFEWLVKACTEPVVLFFDEELNCTICNDKFITVYANRRYKSFQTTFYARRLYKINFRGSQPTASE